MTPLRYPIGIQSFEEIRSGGWIYVDKTAYVYRLARENKYCFLGRPRRFGKSLLLSTFEAYFSGRRDLFDGLEISRLETEWEHYPVIHIDLSSAVASEPEKLELFLFQVLEKYARNFGVSLAPRELGVGAVFGNLIDDIFLATGRRVVVLIDEYDKGILEVIENSDALLRNQELLRPFFSQLKSHDAHLRFCMITGVARFHNLTLFSGLNNLRDITLSADYAAVCGITDEELRSTFAQGIAQLGRENGTDSEATVGLLRKKYDGYRFTHAKQLVYNPFSILNCLAQRAFSNYWVMSGTTRPLVKFLDDANFSITELEGSWVSEDSLGAAYESNDPLPLLYQTGYLTITDCDNGYYRLGIPNSEVRAALVKLLVSHYMGVTEHKFGIRLISLRNMVSDGNVDGFLTELQQMIASIPYHLLQRYELEKTYHLLIYQVFMMIGIDARSEIAMSGGRIDMVADTGKFLYVMEFKLGGSPQQAIDQINSHGYALPWQAADRKVIKVGVTFSPQSHTIDSWLVERSV